MLRRNRPAPERATGQARGRRRLWIALLLPLLAAGWIGIESGRQEGLLRTAASQVERGSLEQALGTLQALEVRPFLALQTRRRGARLLFELGEDRRGHRLLLGQRFHAGDPEDERLRDTSARCQRAAALVARVDQIKDVDERVKLLRQAREELPDAPRLLQRLVEEEVLAMTRTEQASGDGRPASQTFEQDYMELRRKAPGMADEVRARVEAAVRAEAKEEQ